MSYFPPEEIILLEFSPGEFQHCMNSPGEKYYILDFSWGEIEPPTGMSQFCDMY